MSHFCYENVDSSKQSSHPAPELHIQRKQSHQTKATCVIAATLFTEAAGITVDDAFHVLCEWRLSKFSGFTDRGNVYFLTVAIFLSKVRCSFFFLLFSLRNPCCPTTLGFISKPKGQLFGIGLYFPLVV